MRHICLIKIIQSSRKYSKQHYLCVRWYAIKLLYAMRRDVHMAEMAEIVVHIIPIWTEPVFCMGIGLYRYSTGTTPPDLSPNTLGHMHVILRL